MFEELKESIVPISQRIAEATNELRGLQDWPKMVPFLVIIIFVCVFLGYVLSKISPGFEPSGFAFKAVVLFVIALIIWGGSISDTKTLAYIDSQDSIEAVTITSKDIQETNRITMFVVYKDANKVILKSESGEIGMSAEDYTLLTKS